MTTCFPVSAQNHAAPDGLKLALDWRGSNRLKRGISTMRSAREAAERRGRFAEALSAVYLSLKGWKIIAHRARTHAGEIDLIAQRAGVLAMIEVKARDSLDLGKLAITPSQQDRLVRAASLWRARSNLSADLQTRFDVIIIQPWRWPYHLPHAFQASAHTHSLI